LPSISGFISRRSILDMLRSALPHVRRDVLDHRVLAENVPRIARAIGATSVARVKAQFVR
jgi:hypothetical protein